jgi:hypothetical protein
MHFNKAPFRGHLPGIFFATTTFPPETMERDRSKIPDEHKWDLSAVYLSDETWRAAKEKLAAALPKLRELQGALASSASRMADATKSSRDSTSTRP